MVNLISQLINCSEANRLDGKTTETATNIRIRSILGGRNFTSKLELIILEKNKVDLAQGCATVSETLENVKCGKHFAPHLEHFRLVLNC